MKKKYVLLLTATLVALTGCAGVAGKQNAANVTEAKAKEIALSHANVTEKDAVFLRCNLDYDDGRKKYDVEFTSDFVEYDYEIDADTGEILSYDKDGGNSLSQNNTSSQKENSTVVAQEQQPQQDAQQQPQQDAQQQPQQDDQQNAQPAQGIDENQAKAIALQHAGISETDADIFRCHLDHDDGRQVYDIEFLSGNTEYDYEIDALQGNVLSFDHDAEYHQPPVTTSEATTPSAPTQQPEQTQAQQAQYLPESEAQNIALSHAGLSAQDVSRIQCELDYDDRRTKYDINFRKDRTEYDYEIDAVTGEILKSEQDFDD